MTSVPLPPSPAVRAPFRVHPLAGALLVLLTLGTLVYGVGVIPGVRPPGAHWGWLDEGVKLSLAPLAALVCLVRVVLVPAERAAWALLAAALTFTGVASCWYYLHLVHLPVVPYPSAADAGWLLFYPLAYVAVVQLLRARLQQFHSSMWLDGLLAGLGGGAVAAALLIAPLLTLADADLAVVITNLAYPVGDLLLLLLILAVCGMLHWRPGRAWLLLGAGMVVQAVTDSVYATQVSAGTYVPGTLLDAGWQLTYLFLALAAWQEPRRQVARVEGLAVLVVPGLFALAALGVLTYATVEPVPAVATGLAFAALVVAIARTGLTFREVRALAESRQEARTDDLTGLPNRRLFTERLTASLEGRSVDAPLAVLLVDLDRFKEVNDSLGHAAGDELLVEVGRRFAARVRCDDVLARLGGDEFAVLVPDTDVAGAERVARDLTAALDEAVLLAGITVHVDASVGVAAFPEHAGDPAELLRRADVAMYRAKADRSRVEAYRAENDEHSRERLELLEALRRGIEGDEIVVHYQPKIEVASGRVVGVEALVRWQHPERGLLYPDAFLPLAEHAGLMRALTDRVLAVSLDQCARWRAEGIHISVAVNLSASSLLDVAFPGRVAGVLADRGLPAAALEVEITESVLMVDRVRSVDVLVALRALGVRISIDDYGTGYSSLAYLRELPVDELKLDRSFVMHLDEDPLAAAIVRSTVGLSHSLGLDMVAEGVETAGALDELRVYGCDLAQGYYIGRPQAAEQLADRLSRPLAVDV